MSGVDVLAVLSRIADGDGDIESDAIRVRAVVADVLLHSRLLTDSLADGTDSRAHFIALTSALNRATGGSDGR